MFYGATPQVFTYAKQLREAMTPCELALWESLRMNRLDGFRFKAQHPIGNFVADLYCHAARLVIEIDGSVHDSVEQQEYDTNRTHLLDEFGVQVIRFSNEDVLERLQYVLAEIVRFLPSPL